jgi:hypothetical protein
MDVALFDKWLSALDELDKPKDNMFITTTDRTYPTNHPDWPYDNTTVPNWIGPNDDEYTVKPRSIPIDPYDKYKNRPAKDIRPPSTYPYYPPVIPSKTPEEIEQNRQQVADMFRQLQLESERRQREQEMAREEAMEYLKKGTIIGPRKDDPKPEQVKAMAQAIFQSDVSQRPVLLELLKNQNNRLHELVVAEIKKLDEEHVKANENKDRKIELDL